MFINVLPINGTISLETQCSIKNLTKLCLHFMFFDSLIKSLGRILLGPVILFVNTSLFIPARTFINFDWWYKMLIENYIGTWSSSSDVGAHTFHRYDTKSSRNTLDCNKRKPSTMATSKVFGKLSQSYFFSKFLQLLISVLYIFPSKRHFDTGVGVV